MVDEYRPAIYHFDENGLLIERFVPIGTAAAAGQSAGTFGTEVLPEVLAQRRQNRGFEAVAYDGGKIYAFMQSPLRNPTTLSNGSAQCDDEHPRGRVRSCHPGDTQFIYVMDNREPGSRAEYPRRQDRRCGFVWKW